MDWKGRDGTISIIREELRVPWGSQKVPRRSSLLCFGSPIRNLFTTAIKSPDQEDTSKYLWWHHCNTQKSSASYITDKKICFAQTYSSENMNVLFLILSKLISQLGSYIFASEKFRRTVIHSRYIKLVQGLIRVKIFVRYFPKKLQGLQAVNICLMQFLKNSISNSTLALRALHHDS